MTDYKFGNRIYKIRTEKGLTQSDIAMSLGISDKAVSKWENGTAKPTIKNLRKLSDILDITLDDLLDTIQKEKITQITKIVITGGPLSGKTSSLKFLKEHFERLKYKVIIIPDIRKILIESGINPNSTSDYNEYEKTVLQAQLQLEETYEVAINNINSDKILIIYDGGPIDIKAITGKKIFNIICNNLNVNEEELRNSYDAIFHLKTVAKWNKNYYNSIFHDKNIDKDYAVSLDDKLINAWIPHANYRIIDCYNHFNDKVKILIKEISKFLNTDENNYIEKKFIIEKPDLNYLNNLKDSSKIRMILTYLNESTDDIDVKLLMRKESSKNFYQLIKKGGNSKTTNYLTADKYIELLENRDLSRKQILKDRYGFVYNSIYYKIDIFDDWDDKAILEIDLLNKNDQIIIPKFITVLEDVSENQDYRNYNLAKINTETK